VGKGEEDKVDVFGLGNMILKDNDGKIMMIVILGFN